MNQYQVLEHKVKTDSKLRRNKKVKRTRLGPQSKGKREERKESKIPLITKEKTKMGRQNLKEGITSPIIKVSFSLA